MKYDAAIIGAGANGLTAAAVLSRAGCQVVVVERAGQCGGRLVTDAFHPGFHASPFADRVAEIPPQVAAALARELPLHVESLPEDLRLRRDAALAHVFVQASEPYHHGLLARWRRLTAPAPPVWPGSDLVQRALTDWPVLTAWALMGRATDPQLAGSALTLLGLPGAEPLQGGLGALGHAFTAAAQGAEFRLGTEAKRDRPPLGGPF